ncbi:MAG: AAA family ATPase [Clostridia bacterium]|nr:AAA family ATPase [Clostridia bacterium]
MVLKSDALYSIMAAGVEYMEGQKQTITKIVITGGPCAGKTTAMSWIQNAFIQKGYMVLFVDETATELISGGAPWKFTKCNRDYQFRLTQLMLAKELAFTEIAKTFDAEKVLIVCDRGALDNRAYMSDEEFKYVLKRLDTNEVALRDHYDAVFHLVTAAKGAEQFYTLANNAARYETVEEARAVDDALIASWTGHPHLRVIDNRVDFDEKMLYLIKEISAFLGEPRPMDTRRKFLIAYPDVRELAQRPNCQSVDILQAYLKSEIPGEVIRIRQRGQNGNYIYFKTRKRQIEGMKRIELEERLTQDEYLELLMQADPDYRPIRKQRYCLSENGLYYNIDVFPQWTDQALMEIELYSEDQEVKMPEGIQVIREVTGEDEFTNPYIARIKKEN